MKSKALHKPLALALAIPTVLVGINEAYAQTLEEVVVTARKRAETLMDAPVAVAAVTGAAIESQGVTNMEQLSAKVPGLQIGRGAQTTNIRIRGVGSGINQGFEQSAGMYIDGIYQPRSRQFTQSFVDLQQVEVLRGPQGTLFGKNTVAGAIKVETANPQVGDEFNGSIKGAWEPDQGTQRYTAVLSGSLSDNAAARLVLRDESSDGYMDNKFRNTDEQQKDNTLARLSFALEPTENLSVVAKVSHVDMESTGKEANIYTIDDRLPAAPTLGLSALVTGGEFRAANAPGGDDYEGYIGNAAWGDGDIENTEATSFSVKADWNVGDYTLTALTGVTNFEFEQRHDVDFLPVNFIENHDWEELEMFSQEIRIASNWDGAVNFIAGLYYENQELDKFEITQLDGTMGGVIPTLFATPFGPTDNSIVRTDFNQETETVALFTEVSIDLSDTVTLDLGLRYSEDEKDMTKLVTIGQGTPGAFNAVVTPDITAGSTDLVDYLTRIVGATGDFGAAAAAAVMAGSLNRYAASFDNDRSEDHFDPSIRLRWDYSETGMLYLSYSEGYKSGGFNFSPDTANPDGSRRPGHEFEDEGVSAWELGVKQELLEGRARLTTTIFKTELEDLQVTSWGGTSFVVGNAAELTVQGLELEGQLAVTDELEIGGSYSYLDHEFDSYPGAGCSVVETGLGTCPDSAGAGTKDLAGERGAFAPEHSATIYADYTYTFEKTELNVHIDVNYKDEFFLDGDLDSNVLQDAYTKVDARVSLRSNNETWEVALYGRNLTDETTYTASVDAPLSPGVYVGWVEEPRVYGFSAAYNF
jgi:outer membrane receptor protein involved in Fe transport